MVAGSCSEREKQRGHLNAARVVSNKDEPLGGTNSTNLLVYEAPLASLQAFRWILDLD